MDYIIFKENLNNVYRVALLIKESAFRRDELKTHYIDPLVQSGIPEEDIIALTLKYDEFGKCPSKLIKEYLQSLLKACKSISVTTLIVCDGNYFKALTKQRKAESHYGYVLPCLEPNYESMSVILNVNYQGLFYNPAIKQKRDLSNKTVVTHLQGNTVEIGSNVIHKAFYPESVESIKQILDSLHQYPALSCDIETFTLKHYSAGIGTISFAWNKHEGVAFCVDYKPLQEPEEGLYGLNIKNHEVRELLKEFFTTYTGNLKFHNISFDVTVLIYQLWMNSLIDVEGLYTGLDILTKNFDCTQVITYLATNSCAGNHLSLKEQAHEFVGNYAEDVTDIRKLPKEKLLQYNLIDCLATWFVYEKNYPILVKDQQEEIYLGLMKDSLVTIIQMQLTGMPMCMDAVKEAKKELQDIESNHLKAILESPLVEKTNELLKQEYLNKDFIKRKENAKNPDKIKPKLIENINKEFNPNSGSQIATLLYEVMSLPVIETTDKGNPATDEDSLKKLINHTSNPEYKELINHILGLNKVNKILSTFIPAFEKAQLAEDGIYYLFGSFKLGGTKSGRLSSSDPNLQQIPSGSTYGKIIKKCFKGNKDWIFSGSDFSSLEDRINALLTKDTNKLKVYTDGYCGHSLRAFNYYHEQMPDIEDTVESINSIAEKYPQLRQESKAPTFALTFQGTYHTLMKNCGFSEEKAKAIEAKYHEMYAESTAWVKERLKQASKDGFVTLAFGLRLRTPMLKQVIWNSSSMPYEASAEGRTAGNAVSGQSFGLLNCRAVNELMKRVRNSPYKYDIRVCAQIHDASYYLVRNNVDAVKWLNDNLIECMEWQELPEIQHDQVKLGAELDLYYPSWKDKLTLPNYISSEEITQRCIKHITKD